jgi:hypothetical protein
VPPPADSELPRPKRSRKTATALATTDSLADDAWESGIRDSAALRSFLADRAEVTVKVFEMRLQLLTMDEHPLFRLGGAIDAEDTKRFWERAKVRWTGMFGSAVSVSRDTFFRIAIPEFRLPNQTQANAETCLDLFFEGEEVGVVAFCIFLAQFGPIKSLMRKVGSYWKCPAEARDVLKPVNATAMKNLAVLAEVEGNSFAIATGRRRKTVYNLVAVESDGVYLADSQGGRYAS